MKLAAVAAEPGGKFITPKLTAEFQDDYPLTRNVVLRPSSNAPQALHEFAAFCATEPAARIFEKYGLITPWRDWVTKSEQRLKKMKTAKKPVVAMAGGKGMAGVADALAVDFVRAKEVIVPKFAAGSELASVSRFADGRCEILVLDEPISAATQLRVEKKWQSLKPAEHVIAGTAVAVVVNQANTIDSLTMSQIRKLYSGEVADWSAIGGTPGKVKALATRPASSRADQNTTRIAAEIFEAEALPASDWKLVTRVKDPAAVLSAVAMDRGAVGFVPLSVAEQAGANVKILGIKVGRGATARVVKPTPLNLQTARYPMSRQLTIYVHPKASPPAKRFAEFLATTGESAKNPYTDTMAAVKTTLAKHGMVPLSKAAIAASLEAPPANKPTTEKPGQKNPKKPKSATDGW